MTQVNKSRSPLVLWATVTSGVFILFLVLVWSKPVQFDADIINLLDVDQEATQIVSQVSSAYQQKALFLLTHQQSNLTKSYLKDVKSKLLQLPFISEVEFDPSASIDMANLASIYSQYPLALLSANGQQARKDDNYDYINRTYFDFLTQPSNPIVSLTGESSPLMNLADWFSSMQAQSAWEKDGEFLYVEQNSNRHYPLFVTLKEDALSVNSVVASLGQLEQVMVETNANSVGILQSGFIFHHSAITERAQFEMQLFGGMSILGVILLTLIYFRSIRPLILISVLLMVSILAGLTALLLVFETVHLLSLVFAISLIGISVDYGYHILLSGKYTGLSGKELAKYMAPSLIMGGGTTMVSYLLLWFIPIPFLHQVAIFVISGLLFAIFTGLTLITWLPSTFKSAVQSSAKVINKRYFYLLASGGLIAIVVAVISLRFEDNIVMFNSTPGHLVDNEKTVNQLIGNQQYPRFILLKAESEEQLLQRFEAVRQLFARQSDTQLLGIDQWVPSKQRQQENSRWLVNGITQGNLASITDYIDEQYIDELIKTESEFMTISELPNSIKRLYPSFIYTQTGVAGVLSYMDILDDQQRQSIIQAADFELEFVDQPAQLSSALKQLRTYMMYFLVAAALGLFILMFLRYGLKDGLILACIPLFSTMFGLTISQLIIGSLSLFNFIACILILALSIDYTVFLKEHGRQTHVLIANSLAAMTSLLAFGMFIFSNTPAIAHFGLTLLGGLTIAWGLCFLMPSQLLNSKEHNATTM